MQKFNTDDVFGLSASLPLNYVERPKVDDVFKTAVRQKKHIVIHGGSKQGKTSLRRKHIPENSAITVVCQNKWSLSDLFVAVLKQAGYRVELSSKRATETRNKIAAFLEGSIGVPLIGKAKTNVTAEREGKKTSELATKPLELDPADANDIIEAIRSSGHVGYIILEDFHYLPADSQKDFAFALKAFFEISDIRFIVIGVWKEADRLAAYNGDLRLRIVNVDADAWSSMELKKVIAKGEKLLNVEFSDSFQNSLIKSCFESVALVQEACGRVCTRAGVDETQPSSRAVRAYKSAGEIVKDIVLEGAGQFQDFVVNMSGGFQTTQLQIYYWIMSSILESEIDELKKGLSLSEIFAYIKETHPYEVQMASVTQSLNALRSLQAQKNIRPIILDYDNANRRLEVMDRSFLIWKGVQSEDDVNELIVMAQPTTA